ncbi:DNA mismatch repair endonuclease MutL [Alteromonas sp. Cnat2-8]|uniref:DNA mismatch repair endonuclease MutL n=1 Tax=Alteromonas TaxID=226 RepID=UPI001EF50147|nr:MULTISPECIES: DNA mismatch repair endonuclease MutL [Alteromonas]MCG7653830.1 DNA mismatch repair endonuclease MutL [Alteromonas sp. Cnat2-8]USI28420.1 DNA mismatch repair endonuclease MutL [Alteromonas macleodii]
MPIQLLSPQLANQIAAGEVVERPASVVKELLENSLDAGATKIEVDIEKGGHKRIRIKDNGSGIVKSELQLALSRHATSKITTLDDLEQILSLGFRGEALASISSVSRLTLTSRTESQGEAWQAYCEGREMAVNIQPAAHPVGTTIDVADLFYNTPARRKFLRTEKTEFQHIEEVIKRIALSYPKVSFVLKHNDKVAKRFIADKAGSLATRIGAVVGQKFVQNAVHISTEYEGLQIDAWLGNEAMLRSSNDCQFSFVNGRGMRDKLIMHAIRQAYESVWGVVEQPSFVVYLTVNPKDVDVNVHPAKHEVRFQQGRLVHDFICKTVSDALHAMTDEQPLSGMDANRPSGSDFMSSQVEHDYIRPLQNQTSDNAQAFNESSRYSTGGISQGAPQSYGQFTGSPRNTSSGSASGGRSGGAAHKQSRGPSAAYQSNYNALMTPNSDIINNNADPMLVAEHVNLTSQCRIYPKSEKIYLLCATKVASIWLSELFLKAQHGQPLLMPVAVSLNNVNEQLVTMLNDAHFEVNKVAGKYRLQQVPAGTRHLPWLKWFEYFLLVELNDEVNSLDDAVKSLVLPEHVLDEETSNALWYWLDQQSEVKQWEIIEQFAKVRPLNSVLDVWGE